MKATEKLIKDSLYVAKEQHLSWVLKVEEERTPEAVQIVADLSILIASYEHDLRLIQSYS